MQLIHVKPETLVINSRLSRSGSPKQFQAKLKASIEEIGIVEPLKIAPLPNAKFLVVDGVMRLRAIQELRSVDPTSLQTIPAYLVDHSKRFELRYQTDIYQDLLPSQLASLVEHLHEHDRVSKTAIARYIGVSTPTLRNYTGLWRLVQRGGLFAKIVDLMDARVIPSSNPYAWLRLTSHGVRLVIEETMADGAKAEPWIEGRIKQARRGDLRPLPIKHIEQITGDLPSECYRERQEVRSQKRDLGLRRAGYEPQASSNSRQTVRNLEAVKRGAKNPVLKAAAQALSAYLR